MEKGKGKEEGKSKMKLRKGGKGTGIAGEVKKSRLIKIQNFYFLLFCTHTDRSGKKEVWRMDGWKGKKD